MGSDNMDIDESIVKSLDEMESHNARRNADQFASATVAAKTMLTESNAMNFEDVIPLTKTKIAHLNNGTEKSDAYARPIDEANSNKFNMDMKDMDVGLNDSTSSNSGKSKNRSEDDCDIDKIAEIVAKTVSASEHKPFSHISPNHSSGLAADCNGIRQDPNRLEEDQPLLPQAEVKIPTTSSPIPHADTRSIGFPEAENGPQKMFAGVEAEYKSFETDLSSTKCNAVDAETVDSSQTEAAKQEEKSVEGNGESERDTNEQESKESRSQNDSNATTSNVNAGASTSNPRKPSKSSKKKSGKKNGGGGNGKGNKNKGSSKKKGRPMKNKPGDKEKKVKVKEDAANEVLNRFRGPYVQVEADGSETVINAPITEEVAEKQGKLKKSLPGLIANDRNRIRGLYVSTLSHKYDAATTDKSWMCVFCKLGPHKYGLGDLFGPYILSTTDEDFELSQNDPNDDMFRSNRTRGTMLQSRGIIIGVAKSTSASTHNGDVGKVSNTQQLLSWYPQGVANLISLFQYPTADGGQRT